MGQFRQRVQRRGADGRGRRAASGARRGAGAGERAARRLRRPALGLRYAALMLIKFSLCTSGKQLVLEATIIKKTD